MDSFLQNILKQLSELLTGRKEYTVAFRIHNKQLQTLGDLSFQTDLNFAAWRQLQQPANEEKCAHIFEYASKLRKEDVNEETISRIVDGLGIPYLKIVRCCLIKTSCHVFLNREFVMQSVIQAVIGGNYCGAYVPNAGIRVIRESVGNDGPMSVSQLRVKILHDIVVNFNATTSHHQENVDAIYPEVLLTTKSSDVHRNKILCGCVVNNSGQKEEAVTALDLYEEYAASMRMMFEHKYGVRNITDQPNWKQKVDKLGHAAVTFQMIQNTPQKTVALASKHHVIKDAAFVVYNGARICNILRRFEAEVVQRCNRKLPNVEEMDFSLLKLDEEWELVYAFLTQYPDVISSCVSGLHQGKLNLHKLCEFLVRFATAFSVYYSRIKIITELREHLLPTLHARIYLLKAIDCVLRHATGLLNIELVNQM